jgi:hypothetical protein
MRNHKMQMVGWIEITLWRGKETDKLRARIRSRMLSAPRTPTRITLLRVILIGNGSASLANKLTLMV